MKKIIPFLKSENFSIALTGLMVLGFIYSIGFALGEAYQNFISN